MPHLTRLPRLARLTLLAAAAFLPMSAFAQDISTADAVAQAHWGDNVTISEDGGSFRYTSDGLPNHALAEAYLVPIGHAQPFTDFEVKKTDGFVTASPIDVTITMTPHYTDTVTQTSLGMIGVMISGAPIFNDYENPERSIVAMDDQHEQDGAKFLDDCNGHPLQMGNSYHYHAAPPCVTETVDHSGTHATMIGVLLDGFPIYGPQGAGGKIVTNADLDACSGHVEATPEFPQGIYHYHLTTEEAPYSIDCYHGTVPASVTEKAAMPMPDFAAAAQKLGVSQHALMDALSGQMPPDMDKVAASLGVSADALREAMGPPPNQP